MNESIEFPRNYSRGLTGGPSFSTVRVVGQTGVEQRIAQWTQGRWKYDVSHMLRNTAQADALRALFLASSGSLCGFRFFDWSDHDSTVAGVETPHSTLLLTSTTFQLQKVYTNGGVTYARKLKKPISDVLGDVVADQTTSTVHLFHGVTEITSGWTIDCTTGILTFSSAPGYTPAALFQYHVPCRFGSDEMMMEASNPGQYNWSKIEIIELR